MTRQLELCAAKQGETAIVLAADTDDTTVRGLVTLGLERLGCDVAEVIVRSGAVFDNRDPVDNEAVALALTAADLVVDVNGSLLQASAARDEVLEQSRVLALDISSTSELNHLVAHPGLAKRLGRASDVVRSGNTMVVSSASGTRLEMNIADAAVQVADGVATERGELARWPSGIIWSRPKRSTIVGCVVAMPGDLIVESGHLLRSPVRLEIAAGRVTDVLGETADADMVRSHMESLHDDRAYDIAEVGWGMNLTRNGTELGPFDPAITAAGRGPLTAGRVNLRTGNRADPDVGVTICLAEANLAIDDSDLIVEGVLTGALTPDIYERAAGS